MDGGVETVKELQRRGYNSVVSDLVGTQEVDEWLTAINCVRTLYGAAPSVT